MVALLLVLFLVVSSPVFAKDSKEKHFLIDFPVYPQTRSTLSTNRVAERNVNLVSAPGSPLAKDLKFDYYFEPKIRILARNINFVFAGGVGESFSHGIPRSEQSVNFETEGAIWLINIGVDGSFYRERALGVIKGLRYDSDFYRKSQGVVSWFGLKAGSFSDDFISVKIGKGFVNAQGFKGFRISDIDTSYFDLYRYNFGVDSVRIEIGLRQSRFHESIRVTGNIYQRRSTPNDNAAPPQFNEFREYIFDTVFEVTPFLRADNFRLALKGNKFFGNSDSLIFRSRYPDFDHAGSKFPSLQIVLRLAF